MNQRVVLGLVLVGMTLSVHAQDKPTMGVLEAKLVGKELDQDLVPLFTEAVRGRVVKLVKDTVDVLEGSKLDRLIQVNATECATSSCLAQFARTAGVDYLLETQMIFRKGTWTAVLKLASAKSENLLDEETRAFADEAEAQKGLPDLASRIVNTLVPQSQADHAGVSSPGVATAVAQETPASQKEPASQVQKGGNHWGWWLAGGAVVAGGATAAVLLLSNKGSSSTTSTDNSNGKSWQTTVVWP